MNFAIASALALTEPAGATASMVSKGFSTYFPRWKAYPSDMWGASASGSGCRPVAYTIPRGFVIRSSM